MSNHRIAALIAHVRKHRDPQAAARLRSLRPEPRPLPPPALTPSQVAQMRRAGAL